MKVITYQIQDIKKALKEGDEQRNSSFYRVLQSCGFRRFVAEASYGWKRKLGGGG